PPLPLTPRPQRPPLLPYTTLFRSSHGLDYLIAAVILAGVFQVVLALLGAARLMRFIPRQVMLGFVNALAILIFISQVPELIGVRSEGHTSELQSRFELVGRLLLAT